MYAGEQLLVFDAYAKYWETRWVSGNCAACGAGNWAIALTIKEALTTGPRRRREARLGGGGGFLGAMQAGATITAATTGTGMVAGGVGAASRGTSSPPGCALAAAQALARAQRPHGGVARLGTVADAAKASGAARKAYAVGKAVALETGESRDGDGQGRDRGRTIGDAAVGALVSTPIGALGGAGVDKIAKGGKAAVTAADGGGRHGRIAGRSPPAGTS